MLVVMQSQATPDQVSHVVEQIRSMGLTPHPMPGQTRTSIGITGNTGAVDAIGELAEVAAREGLWLHVDAAYGAAVRLSARDADRVRDLDRADSVTVDPHKWFYQAYDIGGLMVRRGALLEEGDEFGQRSGGHQPL